MITAENIKNIISEIMEMSLGELKKMVADDKLPVLRVSLGKVLLRVAQDGDSQKLTAILDRAIGRVGDTNEDIFDEDKETKELSDEELLDRIAAQEKN